MMSKSCSRKYQRTPENYNSCCYDLYMDYASIPSNISKPEGEDISKLLKDTMPIAKKVFFKYQTDELTPSNSFSIQTGYSIGYLTSSLTIDKDSITSVTDNVSINGVQVITNNDNPCTIKTNNIPLRGTNPIVYATTTGKNLDITIMDTNTNKQIMKATNLDELGNITPTGLNVYCLINIPKDGYFTKFDLYNKTIIKEV